MNIELQGQVKSIISSVLTIIIAVSSGFVSQNRGLWFAIGIGGIIQVSLICIPSIEERFYRKRMKHMERQDELDMNFEEESKSIELKGRLEKLNKQTLKKNKGKDKNYIRLDKLEGERE